MAYDLLIVGGGINGCAIAREAALSGLSVLLVERDDLAQHTSSASSKLIHGGLRYLEYHEFALVREALQERERLIRAAPHLIHPMAFVLPHDHAVRPWWMVRAGLYLYDALALGTTLPRSRRLRAKDDAYRAPLTGAAKGFVYYDAFVDDSRLTLANAIDAHDAGAEIATRTALLAARRKDDHWRATLSDGRTVLARAVVNAAGPWVGELFAKVGVTTASHVRLVKGSHIVVPRLYDGDHAYILQQPDGRIVFAIPWLRDYTAIGTTDIPVERPEDARIGSDEIAYLCAAANTHFTTTIAPEDIVDSWSGVRPLFDDGASDAKAVTRDYVLELDDGGPPLLSVFGGKITTGRHLAEDALAKIAPAIGLDARPVTHDRAFPGGDTGDFDNFLSAVRQRFPFLGEQRSARMAHAYGTRLWEMLGDVRTIADMGPEFGAGLTAVELGWMRTREWARSADDVLDRRSKLRLTADPATVAAVEAYFRENQ
ncbi:glycerol-3-phosphate dehydrogenase [Sphingomonas floccifaciens]|uniref:Glycerol-3-phosphate dehydrogenase n=1 Tax=Sphingomonas floccifaciens TaxID=1844115 RepID=A0ABW4NDJ1_9SPHN